MAIFLALAAVCLAFPAEEPKAPVVQGPVQAQPVPAPTSPEGAADLQTDNTFWYGGGHHRHYYPVYRSYYVPRCVVFSKLLYYVFYFMCFTAIWKEIRALKEGTEKLWVCLLTQAAECLFVDAGC